MTTRQIRKLNEQQLEAALAHGTITHKQYIDECLHRSVNREAIRNMSPQQRQQLLDILSKL